MVFAAVLDGHGGWQAAEFAVRLALLSQMFRIDSQKVSQKSTLWQNIQAEIFSRPAAAQQGHRQADAIGAAMERGYERTDRAFMTAIKPAFDLGFGQVSSVGCCAVSAVMTDSFIVVANAGDCRAVVGSHGRLQQQANSSAPHPLASSGAVLKPKTDPSGWSAITLSQDHNCRHDSLQMELKAAHPDEEDIVVCRSPTSCYVKGRLQPTRALGDLYLKHSEFNGKPGTRLYGRHVKAPYTPPYITATPEVRVHQLQPQSDAFLILACDGIWVRVNFVLCMARNLAPYPTNLQDVLSSDEAVDFIANDSGDPMTVSERLVNFVLEREGASKGLTVDQLRAVCSYLISA
jgi:pyruvate dehydrogenase phosphatase